MRVLAAPHKFQASDLGFGDLFVRPDDIKESQIISALQQVGARVCDNTIHEARASLLRGIIEAHRRAKLFQHPLVQARGDVIGSLLDNDLVLEARRSQSPNFAPPSRTAISENGEIYTQQTHLRFSEIIEPTLRALQETKGWNPDNGQRQAIAERFA